MRAQAALVERKGGPFVLADVEIEEPREDEVLVRIAAAGICHTDLIVRDQWYPVPLPIVLGHEGAGVVEAVGERVKKVKPGDHVVLTFRACGRCRSCLRGRPFHCMEGFSLLFGGTRPDGTTPLRRNGQAVHYFFGQSSFATYALAHEQNTVPVPADVPLEYVGPLGCGIQTGAGAILNALRPSVGSSVVIFGTGAVGLSALLAARMMGCTPIIGVDLRPERLQLARELGATHVLNPSEGDVVLAIRDLTGGGADYSVDTTGSPQALRQAVECLAPGGVCGLIGAAALGTEAVVGMDVLLYRTVRGIIEGESVPDLFIPQLVELYRQGRFPFDRLLRFYPFERINEAAADAEHGRVVKPVLTMAI